MSNMNKINAEERQRANTILSAAINRALMEIHKQTVGVRIVSIETDVEPLNPPGHGYTIKCQAQVTLINKKETPE